MIEREVQVIAEKDGFVLIEAQRESACGHCDVSHGCGTSLLGRWMNKSNRISMPDSLGLHAGDHAVIGIDEKGIVVASSLAYMLPLICMLIVALVAQNYIHSQGLLVLVSLTGLMGGLFVARSFTPGNKSIVLLRKTESNPKLISIEVQEK
jgi:sigma-E factor negative regulatory protein RseC